MRILSTLLIAALLTSLGTGLAQAEEKAKLKGLLITGGCCHDYPNQIKIITQGLSQRVSIDWDVELAAEDRNTKVPAYKNHDWIKPYDLVVHNECYGGVTDVDFVESIVKAHTETGVPAIFIHCSMHSYRQAKTDDWRKLLGATSMSHEKARPLKVMNLAADHPIMTDFPKAWNTPNGELYKIDKVWPGAKVLAEAYGEDTKKDHAVIWTNEFEGTKVFTTTLGHHNVTMLTDEWLGVVSRGVLWTVDALNDDGTAKSGYEGTGIAEISLRGENPDADKSPTPAK
ncbi:MAG: ThuA domain-containing protein [Pirellulaceae bacterium]